MTSSSRGQGRPVRGFGEFGRDRLLELTREVMKEKPKVDIQRREIAEFAGVTPALVSYYFPDKWSLLDAAARPIVEDHVLKIRTLLGQKTDPLARLRGLIFILVEFSFNEGHLLESYMDNRERGDDLESIGILRSACDEIFDLFREMDRGAMLRQQDAHFACVAFLELCKTVGQQLRSRDDVASQRKDLLQARCDDLLRFLVNGAIVPLSPVRPAELQARGFSVSHADRAASSLAE